MEPVVQAEPLEAQMPSRSSSSNAASASTPSNPMLLCSAPGSLPVADRSLDGLENSVFQFIAQCPDASVFVVEMAQGQFSSPAEGDNVRTFSVPPRWPRSCPPPTMYGWNGTPVFT